MAAIDQYIERIPNTELQEQIREEVARLTKKKRFGLVYENHLPDNVIMPEVTIRRGTKVALRDNTPNDVYEVQDMEKDNAVCRNLASLEDKTFLLDDLVAVAQRGDVIYPYLKPIHSVRATREQLRCLSLNICAQLDSRSITIYLPTTRGISVMPLFVRTIVIRQRV